MHRFVRIGQCALLAVFALSTTGLPAQTQEKDPWAPLQFLIGKWTGGGSGKPGEAITGYISFSYDLNKKVIIRKNHAEFIAKPGDKSPAVHEDLMTIYQAPGDTKLRAIYFDSEGHVINYTLSFPAKPNSVVFESDATDKAPRFRLVNELGADGSLSIEFLMAPPGGEFRSYTKGSVKKQK